MWLTVGGLGHRAGGEDTEEVLGWAAGVKYDFKRPQLFGK